MDSGFLSFNSLYTFSCDYSADSVEWCPLEPYKNLFVCANYELTESEECEQIPKNSKSTRVGRILLFSISQFDGLTLLQQLDTDAVLDQKWCHNDINGLPILGVVNAKNKIELYRLLPNLKLELFTSFEFEVEDSELLILSLDWSTGKYPNREPEIVCSDSKGNIHLLKLSDNKLDSVQSWHGHEYEAWIACFSYWDKNVLFSGGDDSLFLKYDIRVGTEPIARNRKHEAGVTSMHSTCFNEFILSTGSYDEHVRIWDMRNFKHPLSDIRMSGPLWRLKWNPFNKNLLLCACMLGGVQVIDTQNLEIIGSFTEHKSIAYGTDWCHLNDGVIKSFDASGSFIIGSCSFYDKLLCVSTFTNKV